MAGIHIHGTRWNAAVFSHSKLQQANPLFPLIPRVPSKNVGPSRLGGFKSNRGRQGSTAGHCDTTIQQHEEAQRAPAPRADHRG